MLTYGELIEMPNRTLEELREVRFKQLMEQRKKDEEFAKRQSSERVRNQILNP